MSKIPLPKTPEPIPCNVDNKIPRIINKRLIPKAQKQTKGYQHSRSSFFILVGVSFLLIILCILLSALQGIVSGVLGSGILLIIWNLIYTNQYWLLFPKSIKLIGLGIILIALIVMGYFKI